MVSGQTTEWAATYSQLQEREYPLPEKPVAISFFVWKLHKPKPTFYIIFTFNIFVILLP